MKQIHTQTRGMKNFFLILFTLISFTTFAQVRAVKDAQGNFQQVPPKPKTEAELVKHATLTGFTFTDNNKKSFLVYQTSKGKYFVIVVSKTGKPYRKTITEVPE